MTHRQTTHPHTAANKSAFTLVELAIVLVVIGLIIGGVLVGQDLIKAAQSRAQITQIERYNAAARTFQDKYACLPGDCLNAAKFGFVARGSQKGQGDGDGVIEGYYASGSTAFGDQEAQGETVTFWVDLSQANLIDGSYTNGSPTTGPSNISAAQLPSYFPVGKLGNANYVYVWSGGIGYGDRTNYFAISGISSIGASYFGGVAGITRITPQTAANIDAKKDDGLPQGGHTRAVYLNNGVGGMWVGATGTAAAAATTTSCYDNNNTAGATQRYSTTPLSNNFNCALSMRFQ